jgi:prepilin-type N-terminal cleavage/methylation domain-containing protein
VLAQIRKMRKDDGGFTLIELLMVIVIIGILAGIVVFSVRGINDTGAEAACKADYKSYQVASEAFIASGDGTPAANEAGLKSGGFLRTLHPAGENGYTITYTANGDVAASGACTIAAG